MCLSKLLSLLTQLENIDSHIGVVAIANVYFLTIKIIILMIMITYAQHLLIIWNIENLQKKVKEIKEHKHHTTVQWNEHRFLNNPEGVGLVDIDRRKDHSIANLNFRKDIFRSSRSVPDDSSSG